MKVKCNEIIARYVDDDGQIHKEIGGLPFVYICRMVNRSVMTKRQYIEISPIEYAYLKGTRSEQGTKFINGDLIPIQEA